MESLCARRDSIVAVLGPSSAAGIMRSARNSAIGSCPPPPPMRAGSFFRPPAISCSFNGYYTVERLRNAGVTASAGTLHL